MSFNQLGKPSRKKSVWGHNTTASTEVIYTCPANCVSELVFIHVHNSSGNAGINIEWYVAKDTYTSHFLEGKNLGASEFITFDQISLVLEAGDEIRVTSDTAAHLDTIATFIETFLPTG